jgi:hypothetical protein
MLWLRWRLTWNQWRRGGQVNAVITIIAVVLGLGLAVAGGVGGVVAGATALAKARPLVMMLVWDGLAGAFLLFWMMGVVTELQRSEVIDLSRLLHLPVSVRDVFLLNYVSSHMSLSLAVMLPMMAGLAVGLAVGRGPAMLLLLSLVLGFFFMVSAWTYCLRGWLALLMVNKRRRRAVVIGVTLAFVLLAQLPNMLSNVWFRPARHEPSQGEAERRVRATRERKQWEHKVNILSSAHQSIPLLWLPHGAKTLAEGRVGPALWGAAGLVGLGMLGLRRAYLGTLRFYHGTSENGAVAKSQPPPAVRRPGTCLIEKELPLVPEAGAAVALATLRSMMRAPEVKMALAMNVFMLVVIGAGMLLRGSGPVPESARPFVAIFAVLVTFVGLTQVLLNQFGYDREGFRALVLSPAAREHVLLGKTLALLPVAVAIFFVFLLLVTVLARLSVLNVVAACLEFGAAFLALSVLGNLLSILVPYRIAAGSLKPTKTKATRVLLTVLVCMLLPLALAPLAVPPGLGLLCRHLGWLPAAPVTLACAALLMVCSGFLYWGTLGPLGRLLQRQEQRILDAVALEVE